jgi:hypothetical protein
MGSLEDQMALGIMAAAPQPAPSGDADAFLSAVPIGDIASMWCALQRLSRRDRTGGAWTVFLHFDHLPHRSPQRALDLVLEVLRTETDKPTHMQLNNKLMPALLHVHGADVIDRIEEEARQNPKLRWLIGGLGFATPELLHARLDAIADAEAWDQDARARRRAVRPLDLAAMSIAELARAWVEEYSKSDRDRDDNFFAMMDHERDLREEDPDKAIDLILQILEIETNPVLLSVLAAGPLEDVISRRTIDRIERAAAANKRFHDLLGGVWYYRASDELKARLDVLIGPVRR